MVVSAVARHVAREFYLPVLCFPLEKRSFLHKLNILILLGLSYEGGGSVTFAVNTYPRNLNRDPVPGKYINTYNIGLELKSYTSTSVS